MTEPDLSDFELETEDKDVENPERLADEIDRMVDMAVSAANPDDENINQVVGLFRMQLHPYVQENPERMLAFLEIARDEINDIIETHN